MLWLANGTTSNPCPVIALDFDRALAFAQAPKWLHGPGHRLAIADAAFGAHFDEQDFFSADVVLND